MRAVPAGADDVDEMAFVGDLHRVGEFTHHRRGGCDLAYGFLLHAQSGQDRCAHHVGDFAAHDHAHQFQHLVVKDFAVFDGALQGFLRSNLHRVSLG